MRDFIASLELPAVAKQRLLQLTPGDYLGLAAELAQSPRRILSKT
jgi:adenylosuccinate lyase